MTWSKIYIGRDTKEEQDFLHWRDQDFCWEFMTFGPDNSLLDCTMAEFSVRYYVIFKHDFSPRTNGIVQKALLDWALKYPKHGEKVAGKII